MTTASSDASSTLPSGRAKKAPRVDGIRFRAGAILLRILLLVAVVAAWQIAVSTGAVNSLTLPTPWQALKAMSQVRDGEFWKDLSNTGLVVLAAFGIGGAAGLAAGIAFWRLPALGDAVEPFLVTLYATPTLVFYPVLIVLLGLNLWPLILIASVMVFMPIALNTMIGLRSLSPVLPRLARSLGSPGPVAFRKILLPGALPIVISGARVAFLYATMGTIAMEMVVASAGLGYRIGYDYSNFRTQEMYGLVLVVAVLATGLNWILTRVEKSMRRDLA